MERTGSSVAREVTVIPAGPRDGSHLARVLAQAFLHDPHITGMLPGGDVENRLFRLFERLFVETLRSGGAGYLAYAEGAPVGATLWEQPGRRVSWKTVLPGVPAYVTIFEGRLLDALKTEVSVQQHRPAVPHWYLRALGTVPAAQRRGHGSALVRDRLAQVDAQGAGVYLESSVEGNVPFYERFGFRAYRTVPAAGTSSTIGMWRSPVQVA